MEGKREGWGMKRRKVWTTPLIGPHPSFVLCLVLVFRQRDPRPLRPGVDGEPDVEGSGKGPGPL